MTGNQVKSLMQRFPYLIQQTTKNWNKGGSIWKNADLLQFYCCFHLKKDISLDQKYKFH